MDKYTMAQKEYKQQPYHAIPDDNNNNDKVLLIVIPSSSGEIFSIFDKQLLESLKNDTYGTNIHSLQFSLSNDMTFLINMILLLCILRVCFTIEQFELWNCTYLIFLNFFLNDDLDLQ